MKWAEIEFPTIRHLTKGNWKCWLWPVPFFAGINWCICILKRERDNNPTTGLMPRGEMEMTRQQKVAFAKELLSKYKIDLFDEDGYLEEERLDSLIETFHKFIPPAQAKKGGP